MRKIQERHKDVTWKQCCTFLLLLMVMLLFLPKKTFAAEKESREADDPYTYHTAFDAKASLKIRHMKDYGVLDYEETVEVEDSCDYLDGDEAGVKSVTFQVNGENAYGYLKSEKGVHRLVRISPFNAAGKRQTSFVSCDVMPDIKKDLDVEINDDEIRIDTYRSSGAGGQHINKTSSAIRITHYPTGIVVQCQNERSQHMNKDKAMQMLKSKLYVLKQQEQAEKMSDIRGEVRDINFGNQIRSYVMQPYTLVKDHRTNAEISNVGAVMDGNIDPFINAYLSMDAEAQKGKKAE